MVMRGESFPRGCEFESQCRILDGQFFTSICRKIVLMHDKTENKIKQGRVGPFCYLQLSCQSILNIQQL